MFKLFGFGIVLGAALAAAAAYLLPVTDLHREVSIVSVQPNGGIREAWRIHVPDDRILAGGGNPAATSPAGVDWPAHLATAGIEAEVFKLRDANDVVIGLGSRIAAPTGEVEWLLHLPARGSMYFPMNPAPDASGLRSGGLRAGTREFDGRLGSLGERFLPGGDGGTIELTGVLVATTGNEP